MNNELWNKFNLSISANLRRGEMYLALRYIPANEVQISVVIPNDVMLHRRERFMRHLAMQQLEEDIRSFGT